MSLLQFNNNQKLRSFLFFLTLAASIWFLTKFSKPLIAELTLNIEYTNVPRQTLVSLQAPKDITVTVSANGFKLLSDVFGDKTLRLDLSAGRFMEPNEIRFSQDQLLANCYGVLPVASVITLQTHELIVPVDRMSSKEVDVQFQGDLSLAQGFKMIGIPVIDPKKITIYGPSQLIDSIEGIKTVDMRLEDLNADMRLSIPLESMGSSKLSRSRDSIIWSAQIIEYTQKQIELPIEVINIPKGRELQIFPEAMTLSIEIPVNEYALYDQSNFKLICDYTERISEDSFMIPRLSSLPEGVYKPELSHKKVDYVEFTQ